MIERFGPLLLIAGLAGTIADAIGHSPRASIAVAMLVGAAALIPIGKLSAVDYFYSLTGPLSAASLTMIGIGIAGFVWRDQPIDARSGVAVLAVMVPILALPLYAAVIAGWSFDPYRWGFGGWVLPAGLFVLLAVGLWFGAFAVALWLALAGALYLAGGYASRNLVDYLVDPTAVIIAIVVLARVFLRAA